MANNQTKKITSLTDLGTMQQAVFADVAAVLRTAQSGLDWNPLGDCSTSKQCGPHTPVMIYNSTNAVVFVSFGTQSVTAPSSALNGIPILAGEKFVLSSGLSSWVISSAAAVYAYNADFTT